MRLLTHLRALFYRARPYETLKRDDDGDVSPAAEQILLQLAPRLRSRVKECLVEGEEPIHVESQRYRALFWGYCSCCVFMWVLLFVIPAIRSRAGASRTTNHGSGYTRGSRHDSSPVTVFAAVLLAGLMVPSMYTLWYLCRVEFVFTTRRIMKLSDGGALQWVRLANLLLPSLPPDAAGKTRVEFRIAGSDAAGLQSISFHYVPSVRIVERLVLAFMDGPAAVRREAPSEVAIDSILPPAVADAVMSALRPNERVLYCHSPAPWRIALFSFSLAVFLFTNVPWLWTGYFTNGKQYALLFSFFGLIIATIGAVFELKHCKVVYFITSQRLGVLYQRTGALFSVPLGQLRAVWALREGTAGAGQIGFSFQTDELTEGSLANERRTAGACATYHLRHSNDAAWQLTVRDAHSFQLEVLARLAPIIAEGYAGTLTVGVDDVDVEMYDVSQ
eukprot:TRINITY_DN80891_c0_g1_i1.p1 TRINITY_DN80891_c0_g1~~TRINITY_DN80891_c0_g1_i1.p1  ORF type:complete len:446 (+),score=53.87 TRINITY_DN80891_c0_g1_i1:115-1452(+)